MRICGFSGAVGRELLVRVPSVRRVSAASDRAALRVPTCLELRVVSSTHSGARRRILSSFFGRQSFLTRVGDSTKESDVDYNVRVRPLRRHRQLALHAHRDRLSPKDGRRIDTSSRRWTQDRGDDNGAAQIADGPEPLHDCVISDRLTSPAVGLGGG